MERDGDGKARPFTVVNHHAVYQDQAASHCKCLYQKTQREILAPSTAENYPDSYPDGHNVFD
jgi:hypothetical protein